jgi:hypothetical protein
MNSFEMKPRDLREFAKNRGVVMKKGSTCFIAFVDWGEVISHLLWKPVKLTVERDNQIWGRFVLPSPRTDFNVRCFIPYCRSISAFSFETPPELTHLGIVLPGVEFYDPTSRDKITRTWQEGKGRDQWLEQRLKREASGAANLPKRIKRDSQLGPSSPLACGTSLVKRAVGRPRSSSLSLPG